MEAARRATVDDVDRILDLSRALRAEMAGQRGGDLWWRTHEPFEHHGAALRALLDYDDECVLVGSIDDEIVGYALARIHGLADGTHLATITEIFVEAGAREVSVGESLVDAVLAWAAGRGCVGIDATALPGNRAAKNFFETHGFVARRLTMHRSLAEPVGPGGPGGPGEPAG